MSEPFERVEGIAVLGPFAQGREATLELCGCAADVFGVLSERGGESCSEGGRLLDERALPWPAAHCAKLMSVAEEDGKGAVKVRHGL